MILIAGLQGSGKTTAAAKLARSAAGGALQLGRARGVRHRSAPRPSSSSSCVGERAGAIVYERGTEVSPVEIARWALERARTAGKDVLIVDTAGRLHLDSGADGRARGDPRRDQARSRSCSCVDAMTGQDAVNVAEQFAAAVRLRRRGAEQARRRRARRRRAVGARGHRHADHVRLDRGAPRRLRALPRRPHGAADPRHGRRADADREGWARGRRARRARSIEKRLRAGEFDLEDFLGQLRTMRRMGPLQGLLGMLPGRRRAAARRSRSTSARSTASRRSSSR